MSPIDEGSAPMRCRSAPNTGCEQLYRALSFDDSSHIVVNLEVLKPSHVPDVRW